MKKLYPYGAYCDIKSHVVVLPGPTREEVEKANKKYSSSPKKNWVKVKLH